MKPPKVSIIIINCNNYKDTSECLDSLGEISYPDFRIIVVDNGSGIALYQKMKSEYPQHQFIRNEENLGFAVANNIGIRNALEEGTDYVLMINNDTIVKEDFLEPMVDFLENNREAGMTGGKIYFYNDPDRIWTVGGDVKLLRGGSVYYGGGEKDKGQYDEIKQMSHISGCMSLIRKDVLETVGLLSEQYFFRGEEWDFCYRVSKQGYKLFYIPDSVIWHKISRTVDRYSPLDIYSAYRAKIIFVNNFLPGPASLLWYGLFYVYARFYAPSKFRRLTKGRFNRDVNLKKIKCAISIALKDGRVKDRVTPDDIERVKAKLNDQSGQQNN